MKTTTIAILIALCMPMAAGAQTGAAKKAAESVFTLTTFKADGTLLATSHGVFVGNDGEAVSNLKPFEGAETAIAVDTKGVKHNVTRMLGADDIYNVARFRVDGKTKGLHLPPHRLRPDRPSGLPHTPESARRCLRLSLREWRSSTGHTTSASSTWTHRRTPRDAPSSTNRDRW